MQIHVATQKSSKCDSSDQVTLRQFPRIQWRWTRWNVETNVILLVMVFLLVNDYQIPWNTVYHVHCNDLYAEQYSNELESNFVQFYSLLGVYHSCQSPFLHHLWVLSFHMPQMLVLIPQKQSSCYLKCSASYLSGPTNHSVIYVQCCYSYTTSLLIILLYWMQN